MADTKKIEGAVKRISDEARDIAGEVVNRLHSTVGREIESGAISDGKGGALLLESAGWVGLGAVTTIVRSVLEAAKSDEAKMRGANPENEARAIAAYARDYGRAIEREVGRIIREAGLAGK